MEPCGKVGGVGCQYNHLGIGRAVIMSIMLRSILVITIITVIPMINRIMINRIAMLGDSLLQTLHGLLQANRCDRDPGSLITITF